MSTAEPVRRPRIFYGWWIAISFFFINFYWSGVMGSGFTAFFNPWKESFGLSSAATSLAFSMQQGMAGFGSVVVGLLFDRIGGRLLMFLATALGVGGMLLLAISRSAWSFYLDFAILSVGWTIFFAGIGPALAAIWFRKHRGKANGVLLGGSNVGGLIAPLLVWLIDSYDWRTASVAAAIGLAIVGIPTSMALRHKPEQYGFHPDGLEQPPPKAPALTRGEGQDYTLSQALGTWTFWALGIGQLLAIFGLAAVSVHVLPHLEAEGLSSRAGGWIIASYTVLGIVPKFGFGWLGDVLDKRLVLAGSYTLQGLGILALANVESPWTLALFIGVYGLSAQSYGSVLYPLLADEFGHRHIGAIQGMISAPYAVGAILGPYLAGLTFDRMDEYTWIFIAFGIATVAAGPFAIASRRSPFGRLNSGKALPD